MVMQLKSIEAELVPVEGDESDSGAGQFHAIISSPKRDRDGDQLWADEWEQPLPDHVIINGDHDNNHIMSIIGSGSPTLEADNKIHVRGSYAETTYAQESRKLVNGKHLRSLSCAYREKREEKGISRELINASFVVVPSNTDCVVIDSKSYEPREVETKSFVALTIKQLDAMTPADRAQAIHDLAFDLGAYCTIPKSTGVTVPQGVQLYTKSEDGSYQEFSQAPEAPSKEADSPADQVKEKALAQELAKSAVVKFNLNRSARELEDA